MEMTVMLVLVDTFVVDTVGIACEITAKPCGLVRHPDRRQRSSLLA